MFRFFVSKRRADLAGAEAMYKKAGAIDPFHANSIYNYAVLLDSSLKQQQVSRHHRPRDSFSSSKYLRAC